MAHLFFVVDKAAESRLVHNKKVCEAPQALSSREERRPEIVSCHDWRFYCTPGVQSLIDTFAERRKDKFNGQPGGAIRMVEYRIDLCDIQRGHFARVGN